MNEICCDGKPARAYTHCIQRHRGPATQPHTATIQISTEKRSILNLWRSAKKQQGKPCRHNNRLRNKHGIPNPIVCGPGVCSRGARTLFRSIPNRQYCTIIKPIRYYIKRKWRFEFKSPSCLAQATRLRFVFCFFSAFSVFFFLWKKKMLSGSFLGVSMSPDDGANAETTEEKGGLGGTPISISLIVDI